MAGTSEKWKRLQDATLKLRLVNNPKHWSFSMGAIMLTLVLWLQLQLLFGTTKDWLWLVGISVALFPSVNEDYVHGK